MSDDKISPTKINTYIFCPKAYYLIYEKGVKKEYVEAMEKGLNIHQVIAEYYKMLPEHRIHVVNIKKMLIDAIKKLNLEDTLIQYIEEDDRTKYHLVTELENFLRFEEWRLTKSNIHEKPIAVEAEFEDAIFYGKIDAMFKNTKGEKIVVEFKTGYVGIIEPSKEMLIQGLIYKRLTNCKDVLFVLLKENKKMWLSQFPFRNELCIDEIKEVVERIMKKDYEKMKTENCERCLVRVACEVEKENFKLWRWWHD